MNTLPAVAKYCSPESFSLQHSESCLPPQTPAGVCFLKAVTISEIPVHASSWRGWDGKNDSSTSPGFDWVFSVSPHPGFQKF